MADLQSPQLKLQSCVITHDSTGDGEIQAANTTTAVGSSAAGHRDRENLITLSPDRIWETDVFASEQQNVAFLKTDGLKGLPSATAAADQPRWFGQAIQKVLEILMDREINKRPVIQASAFEVTVVNRKTKGLD